MSTVTLNLCIFVFDVYFHIAICPKTTVTPSLSSILLLNHETVRDGPFISGMKDLVQ